MPNCTMFTLFSLLTSSSVSWFTTSLSFEFMTLLSSFFLGYANPLLTSVEVMTLFPLKICEDMTSLFIGKGLFSCVLTSSCSMPMYSFSTDGGSYEGEGVSFYKPS